MNNHHQTATFWSRVAAAYRWIQKQDRRFTADQVAACTGVSKRAAYRYLKEVQKMDSGLRGSAGFGYLYRRKNGAA
jgi:predicted DNA-binding transcriptional regulator YafY